MYPRVSAHEREERLFTGHTGRMATTLGVMTLVVNLGRQALPPLLPAIIADLGITPSQAGLALTVLWAVYALVQYPSGRLADALTRKTVIVGGLGVLIAGYLVLGAVPNYPVFVLGTALVGIGAGVYIISMRVLLSDLFVERRGQAIGLNSATGQVGNALAAALATAALTYATWQAAFLPVVVLLVLLGFLLHYWGEEGYVVERVDLPVLETTKRLVTNRRIRWLLLAYTLVIFTWQGIMGFLPTFLQVDKGLSPPMASGAFALLFVTAMVVQPLAGRLSDRFPRVIVAGSALVLGGLGLVIMLLYSLLPLIGLGIALLAIGMMVFPPVIQAYLFDIFPDSSMGGDFGAFRSLYQVLASLGPAYVGVVAERADYAVAFAGFIVCLLGAAVILLWMRE